MHQTITGEEKEFAHPGVGRRLGVPLSDNEDSRSTPWHSQSQGNGCSLSPLIFYEALIKTTSVVFCTIDNSIFLYNSHNTYFLNYLSVHIMVLVTKVWILSTACTCLISSLKSLCLKFLFMASNICNIQLCANRLWNCTCIQIAHTFQIYIFIFTGMDGSIF